MKVSDTLYAASDYMREHGYTHEYHTSGGCGCFIHAVRTVSYPNSGISAIETLRKIIFAGKPGVFNETPLKADQWNKRDAIAALTIAADYCAAEGN